MTCAGLGILPAVASDMEWLRGVLQSSLSCMLMPHGLECQHVFMALLPLSISFGCTFTGWSCSRICLIPVIDRAYFDKKALVVRASSTS